MFLWRRVAPQSPEEGLKPTATPGYARNFRDLNRLISEGNSFSGYERNPLFLNLDGKGFANVAGLLGVDFDDDARAVAVVDWDRDGDLDLWVTNRTSPRVRLLQNNQPRDNGSIAIRLVGNGTTTNSDAIGARLTLWPAAQPEQKQIRTVRAGEGFLAQSSSWLHLGLGNAKGTLTARIAWPGGKTETFTGLEEGGRYLITQNGTAQRVPMKAPALINLPTPEVIEADATSGIWLADRMPFPTIKYTDSNGDGHSSKEFIGKPVLVNFWATWCEPCIQELAEFAGNEETMHEMGATVLALNVDDLAIGGNAGTRDADAELARLGYSLPHGRARQENLGKIQTVIEFVSKRREPMVIPTSFLIDARGQVAAIYQGPINWRQLGSDLSLLNAPDEARRARLSPRPGRWLVGPDVADPTARYRDYATLFATNGFPDEAGEFFVLANSARKSISPQDLYNQAKAATAQNKIPEAKKLYRAAIAADPNYGQAFTGLGALFLMEKRPDLAQPLFERALAIDPNHATALINMAMIDQSRGDQASALKRLTRVVERNPDYLAARLNLGSLHASMKNYPEAVQHLDKAIQLDPKQAAARLNLGAVYLNTREWTKAGEQFLAVSKSQPRLHHSHLGLGNAFAGQGRHAEAADSFRKVITMGVTSPKAYTGLGRSLLALGDKTAAKEALKAALKIAPGYPAARELLQESGLE
jgi:tetratricopeptide (TPR) repeat protein/thiol-disulfide isomerase/thioredoxin